MGSTHSHRQGEILWYILLVTLLLTMEDDPEEAELHKRAFLSYPSRPDGQSGQCQLSLPQATAAGALLGLLSFVLLYLFTLWTREHANPPPAGVTVPHSSWDRGKEHLPSSSSSSSSDEGANLKGHHPHHHQDDDHGHQGGNVEGHRPRPHGHRDEHHDGYQDVKGSKPEENQGPHTMTSGGPGSPRGLSGSDRTTKQETEQRRKSRRTKSVPSGPSSRVGGFVSATGCPLNFFLAWTTSAAGFTLRYRRTIESVLRLHPQSCVIVYSATLSQANFRQFWDMGYNVLVERPNLPYLLRGTPAEIWYRGIDRWSSGEYFFSHITEIIRLASLYKYGGVYLDTDVIVLRELDDLHNAIGTELANERGEPKVLNGAILAFDKGSRFIYECMVEFNSTYRIDSWGWNGPELVTRVASRFPQGEELHILPTTAFYPVHWGEVVTYFEKENMEKQHDTWLDMADTYLFHYWNKITADKIPQPGSLMYKILNRYCIFCADTGPDG
ncbi:hypothetical protein CBR_g19150 [Chara braunii]|uniref:Alpha 1,4-glycosyltransferase domain-containing protein n=1 Tax=Chara braunii TaxID=69332 RepID=A0A388KXF8_CHABU|nr:hypothetical protein CBR_g19150 [Chara braunii]|eukprot:GBG74744.1 hypothetical protein CBR_g19150 [Chara braunii]